MKEKDKAQEARARGYAGRVAHTFVITNRPGVIVIPAEPWAISVKVTDTLRLVKPDGHSLTVIVAGFEMLNMRGLEMSDRPKFDGKNAFLIKGENLSKDDVPIGTEIWFD